MNDNRITVRAWGDWACFTRPEMKVERVSYPVITPSAARGVLEAIFWEPQMHYLIDEIRIVRRGRWTAFRRNEVTARISMSNARRWMTNSEDFTPIQAGGGAPDGTQRNMLALGGVEYIITAEVRLTELGKDENPRKYIEEVTRRARSGKCFHRPSFGVREFAADFDLEEDAADAFSRRRSELKDEWQAWDEDLGLMLYDVFDHDERAIGFRWLSDDEIKAQLADGAPGATKRKPKKRTPTREEGRRVAPIPAFFRAEVKDSVLACHPSNIRLIRRAHGAVEANERN